MNKTAWQKSESMEMGILLALTGGILDAYTYLTRGGVLPMPRQETLFFWECIWLRENTAGQRGMSSPLRRSRLG